MRQVSLLYSNVNFTQALNILGLVCVDLYEFLHTECSRPNVALALLCLLSTFVSAPTFVVIVLRR